MGLKPSRIQPLPSMVANQIAAGEVIERPASVVKELLENAFDAGATAIHIDIGFGGLNQIKISDNGSGIVADDLPLAILAHATSKIRQLNDLYAIHSLGFRGEALASIAAVSHLSLISKPIMQEHAMKLWRNGDLYQVSPCARTQGTTVDVLDLFYNAPVRKKFLKTARIEYQAIEVMVKRFALSAPHMALTLSHNGKPCLILPAATCEKSEHVRIKKLLGKLFFDQAFYLDVEQGNLRLRGWVSGPNDQRSQSDKQWIYINQRMVKDKLMNHAIKQAYEGILHPGRYPSCLLYFTLPPADLDVNVHPTKHEVRFQQPRLIHDFIMSTLSRILNPRTDSSFPPITSDLPSQAGEYNPVLRAGSPCTSFTDASMEGNLLRESTCIVLNSSFVLFFLQDSPYLVDLERLQRHRLLTLLERTKRPLESRPLLVPVSYQLNKENHEVWRQCQPLLVKLGIQIDEMSDNKLVVRTLPKLFSQLDMGAVLKRLVKPVPTEQQILKLLIACQSFDAHQLDQEEKTILLDYLHQHFMTSNALVSWCRRLDTIQCREFLHD